jgi:hypothetical protein
MPDERRGNIDDLQTNPIKPDIRPIPTTMSVKGVNPVWLKTLQAQLDSIQNLASISSEEELEALKKEIKLRSLHIDLSDVLAGKRPLSQIKNNAMWTAIGSASGILATLLGGC